MKLFDWGMVDEPEPLERGEAFPQYHANGDRYRWNNPFHWHWLFWKHMQWDAVSRSDEDQEVMLMGGEL